MGLGTPSNYCNQKNYGHRLMIGLLLVRIIALFPSRVASDRVLNGPSQIRVACRPFISTASVFGSRPSFLRFDMRFLIFSDRWKMATCTMKPLLMGSEPVGFDDCASEGDEQITSTVNSFALSNMSGILSFVADDAVS